MKVAPRIQTEGSEFLRCSECWRQR
jgi:hypothetical protein